MALYMSDVRSHRATNVGILIDGRLLRWTDIGFSFQIASRKLCPSREWNYS